MAVNKGTGGEVPGKGPQRPKPTPQRPDASKAPGNTPKPEVVKDAAAGPAASAAGSQGVGRIVGNAPNAAMGAKRAADGVNAAEGGAQKASAALNAADAAPLGTGVGAGAGIAADVVDAGSAATKGDVVGVADSTARATATGVATYFGGTVAGDFTRRVLNTSVGRKTTRLTGWIVAGVVAVILLPLVFGGAIIAGSMTSLGGYTAGVAAACTPNGGNAAYEGGEGGKWAMQFLYDQGLRGDPLRVMWSIVMRESGGDPNNRTPDSGTYPNGTFDAGLYQTNSSNAPSLAEYGLTMDDAFNPVTAFNYWMRRASPNNKLMSSLAMWGLTSWDKPTLNASSYSGWTPQQHQEWIVEPFERYMKQVDDAAAQAGVVIGSSEQSAVRLAALGPAPAITLTVGGAGAGGAQGSAPQPDRTYGPGNPAPPGNEAIPEDQLTVSGHEALKPGDPRLTTFTVANRSITVHKDYQKVFEDFLNAWDKDPDLGQGRLNISKGVGPVDSYEYRKARVTKDRWSDHAGYAVDIRYDILPAFSGVQMTSKETAAVRRLLERFPQLGWGGDYDLENMDEMHFYIAPGATAQPNASGCGGFGVIPATGELAADALAWALAITGGTYNYDTNTSPDKRPPDYNCSTMTSAAYRFASGDKVMLYGNSQAQWMDTKNIVLVPFSEAQPGDIFFEKTINDRGNPVGHVGLIVDVNGGSQAIWHACGASSCQSNGNIGIGYSGLDHVGMWMTVANPSQKDTAAERGKYMWTTDRNKAYVGRVVTSEPPAEDKKK